MTPLKSGAAADALRKTPGAALFGPWKIAAERRLGRQVNIFKRLRTQLHDGQLAAKKGAEGRALRALAKAFDTWMRRQTGDLPDDPVKLAKATDALVKKVAVFLMTYHGT